MARAPSKRGKSRSASPRQRRTTGRVMHGFKHGELKSGRGGKVKSRKQAVAIALHEAGASKYDSPPERRRARAKTERKEARGETAQQETEGRSHVGARGRRESSPAMSGKGDGKKGGKKGSKKGSKRRGKEGGAVKRPARRGRKSASSSRRTRPS